MGLLGALFGGSKSSQESGNKAYDYLSGALKPGVAVGGNAFNSLGDVISGGFDEFKKNSGFDFAYNTGTRNIAGSAAARGLLGSGATAKALARFESNLGSQTYGNWLDRLSGVAQLGNQSAGVLAGAGQWSKGSGSQNGGILSGLFSDRRLKRDITRIGTADNGLPIYSFVYDNDSSGITHIGFMADEVEALHPEAVAKDLLGYKIVDYGKAVL